MATMINSSYILASFFLIFAIIFPVLHANIPENDEYWKERERQARRELDEAYHPDPFNVTSHLNYHVHQVMKHVGNSTRRNLGKKYRGPCQATNPIDSCWRCRRNWMQNREQLADCALGFAKGTTGGKGGRIYVVTDSSDNDMVNPKPGTLRHAVIQKEPLWIIFDRPMFIRLNQELIMNSHKTIDARGSYVHITGGAGRTIQFVQNIIIHGLHIHNIVEGSGGTIRDSVDHVGFRTKSDGDGISIFGSHHIWIDHCSLSRAADGLIDAIQGSTAITISNCHFAYHSHDIIVQNNRRFYSGGTVMMFGASDSYAQDEKMQVTVAFNRFGRGLVQRMPRCRHGFFHIVNNDYTRWLMYAIGGSMHPTVISQGNRFFAPNDEFAKEITHRQNANEDEWKNWTWRSENDLFMNGAFFKESGSPLKNNPYAGNMIPAMPGQYVNHLARFAGPRKCRPNRKC